MTDVSYGVAAYADWMGPSRRSAKAVVPLVLDWLDPQSVIDVGCGLGMWASVFSELGVGTVHGLDGMTVPKESLLIPVENFETVDLSKPVDRGRRYDLVVSLEVGEHLDEEASETFVDTLTRHGDLILFSAAIPLQGGAHHVNEQWPEYWARLFKARGYRPVDCLRRAIWNNPDVEPYYCQNAVFYLKENRLQEFPQLRRWFLEEDELPLSLIHPHYYLKLSSFQGSSLKWWGLRLRHYAFAVLRRLGFSVSS